MPTTTNTTATTTSLQPRPGRLDIVLTILGSAAAIFLAYLSHTDGPSNPASQGGPFEVSVWAAPGMLIVTLPMLWRTSAPLVALGGVIAGLLVHFAAFGALIHCGAVYPMVAILGYAAARRLHGTERMLGFALTVLAVITTGATEAIGIETATAGFPLALIGFGLGAAIAARKPLVPIREELATT